jgi:uncharacterized protein (DUF952 family)
MIYHFCPGADWESAGEVYTASSLDTQGFIHCSPKDWVHHSATLRARGRDDIVILEIDEARLPSPAVWEEGNPPHADGRQFPHVYGPIPRAAVVAVRPLRPSADGSFAPLS